MGLIFKTLRFPQLAHLATSTLYYSVVTSVYHTPMAKKQLQLSIDEHLLTRFGKLCEDQHRSKSQQLEYWITSQTAPLPFKQRDLSDQI